MPADKRLIQQSIAAFDFPTLFREGLGWDTLRERAMTVEVNGQAYTLQPLAEKRDIKAYRCSPDAQGRIPADAVRRKIDREVTKFAYEHLILYTDAALKEQVWQWVRREPGKPLAPRYLRFHQGQTGEAAAQQLSGLAVDILEEDVIDRQEMTGRVRKAFDVEKVTKKFYDRFQKEHATFDGFIMGVTVEADRQWYTSLMLNRLMFIYFIQKKGLLNYQSLDSLDGDQHYLRNRLEMTRTQLGNGQFHSFYRSFLLRLFQEGLSQREDDRSSELKQLLGNVPYLNGGLFDVHQLERDYPQITIPDEAFERIFAFFDEYRWHLDERPTRDDREINPDVLGYIFEKYINQKQMGAYYTKEDITEYIGKNTIIPYLLERVAGLCANDFAPGGPAWSLLSETPDRYIYDAVRKGCDLPLPPEIEAGIANVAQRGDWNKAASEDYALPTESWREVVARRERYADVKHKLESGAISDTNDLITYNLNLRQFMQDVIAFSEGPALLDAVYRSLEEITILDPTCGSGAFLFAALTILEPLYEACLTRMQQMVDDRERLDALVAAGRSQASPAGYYARTGGYFNRFRDILQGVARHPNPRYFILKSIIINNLYGVDIMEEATEICKLRLFLKLAAQIESARHIEPLPDIDFNIRAGNTLVGFATYAEAERAVTSKFDFDNTMERIKSKAEDVERSFASFRAMQTNIKVAAEDMAAMKAQVRSQLKELNNILDGYLASEYGIDHNNIKDEHEYARRFANWRQTHQPFHWFIEFYRIMQDGGFDVIIGNPPYVEYSKVRSVYTILSEQFASESANNLYAFCMERSTRLIQTTGRFGMIVPAGLLGLDEAADLREAMLRQFKTHWFSTFAIRPSKLFEGVEQRLCIDIAAVTDTKKVIFTTDYHHWYAEERRALFALLEYHTSEIYPVLNRIPQVGGNEAARALEKLRSQQETCIRNYYAVSRSGFLMHYHRSPRYWIRGMDFEQYFKSQTRERSIHHFRDLYFRSEAEGKSIGAILNSSLFFFWFISVGNGRNITGTDVEQFPVGILSKCSCKELASFFNSLMEDYKQNSIIRVRRDCELQEFRPSRSKPIIDEIDHILAKHYGFTDEELDFIINYDIKYRMGRGDEEEEGE